jgi:mRNA interferase RelE/StbE
LKITTYQIKILSKARRSLKKLPKNIQNQLKNTIRSLAENPRPQGVKKLSGDYNLYRVRQGDYRVIYEIQDEVLLIIIVLAGHRKQIYRNL